MSNNIHFSIDHPNASRMAFFLNAVKETLEEVPLDWSSWQKTERIKHAFRFQSVAAVDRISITVVFCNSYAEANAIARANSFPYTPQAQWSVNGDLLYVVESVDEKRVSSILGLFAGEE